VFEALRRAVVASGFQLQGADPRVRTVYFKSGRTSMSGFVRVTPDGTAIVSLVGASGSLHDRVATELEQLLADARAAEAAQKQVESTEFAADLERLGSLHERGLLTDEEFADAKARVFEQKPEPAHTPSPEVPSAIPSQTAAASVPRSVSPPPTQGTPPVGGGGGFTGLDPVKAFWQRRSRRGKIAIIVAAVVVGLGVLGALVPTGDDETASTTTTTSTASAVEEPVAEETTTAPTQTKPEKPTDSTLDKRTRQYIAQVQTCQVTVGLTLLLIKRGETDPFKLADSAKTAADTCEAIKTNLAIADSDHFDDEALLAWSGVSEMKSGMNALVAYIDDPRPSKLIEARDKIQRGDAQAAEGIRQINRRRVAYGLRKIQT